MDMVDMVDSDELKQYAAHFEFYSKALNEATEINKAIQAMNEQIIKLMRRKTASERKLNELK